MMKILTFQNIVTLLHNIINTSIIQRRNAYMLGTIVTLFEI